MVETNTESRNLSIGTIIAQFNDVSVMPVEQDTGHARRSTDATRLCLTRAESWINPNEITNTHLVTWPEVIYYILLRSLSRVIERDLMRY